MGTPDSASTTSVRSFEEATAYGMPTHVFAKSLNILGKTLLEFGSSEQKRRHLPRMLRGEEIWLQLLSEPTGGSDLAGPVSNASRDGDTYILNGQMTWSTGAGFADFAMCPARTRFDVPKHSGISMFIIHPRLPGIEIRPIKQINGESDFCEDFLIDVMVPADCMIGEENDGWTVVRGLLEIEHEWVGGTGGVYTPSSDVDDLVALLKRRGLEADDGADGRSRRSWFFSPCSAPLQFGWAWGSPAAISDPRTVDYSSSATTSCGSGGRRRHSFSPGRVGSPGSQVPSVRNALRFTCRPTVRQLPAAPARSSAIRQRACTRPSAGAGRRS